MVDFEPVPRRASFDGATPVPGQDVTTQLSGDGPAFPPHVERHSGVADPGHVDQAVANDLFQGAAAGCAILTSDSASQREALGDAARFVEAGDPQALADALRWLVADRQRVWALRQAAYRRALEAFAPAPVVQPLHERLQAGVRKRR